jgi:hypothetical protein
MSNPITRTRKIGILKPLETNMLSTTCPAPGSNCHVLRPIYKVNKLKILPHLQNEFG